MDGQFEFNVYDVPIIKHFHPYLHQKFIFKKSKKSFSKYIKLSLKGNIYYYSKNLLKRIL
jgi:hypothetical protein